MVWVRRGTQPRITSAPGLEFPRLMRRVSDLGWRWQQPLPPLATRTRRQGTRVAAWLVAGPYPVRFERRSLCSTTRWAFRRERAKLSTW